MCYGIQLSETYVALSINYVSLITQKGLQIMEILCNGTELAELIPPFFLCKLSLTAHR